jgi:hypothetical protein
MRDQYAGDVSDVIKFGLLRALAGDDKRLGIAWYYVPGHDGKPNGRHIEWRQELAWSKLDQELYQGLATLPQRSVAALEKAPIWPPNTIFYRDPVPKADGRLDWGLQKRNVLTGCDLIFLDPDNGAGGNGHQHASFPEIRALRMPECAIVFITFPGRSATHDVLVRRLHERLKYEADVKKITTLRTSISVPSTVRPNIFVPRQRWFTIIDGDDELRLRTTKFAAALQQIPRVNCRVDED